MLPRGYLLVYIAVTKYILFDVLAGPLYDHSGYLCLIFILKLPNAIPNVDCSFQRITMTDT